MTKSFFFYGVVEGEEDYDELWKVLHEHFEKLAREDDAGSSEDVFTHGKAAPKR